MMGRNCNIIYFPAGQTVESIDGSLADCRDKHAFGTLFARMGHQSLLLCSNHCKSKRVARADNWRARGAYHRGCVTAIEAYLKPI